MTLWTPWEGLGDPQEFPDHILKTTVLLNHMCLSSQALYNKDLYNSLLLVNYMKIKIWSTIEYYLWKLSRSFLNTFIKGIFAMHTHQFYKKEMFYKASTWVSSCHSVVLFVVIRFKFFSTSFIISSPSSYTLRINPSMFSKLCHL